MVTKPAKEFTDAQGRRKIKGNMDIELAIDMLEMADKVDHIVLFSGDGDFRRLVEAVQRRGVRLSVVSTVRTSPPMIADELRRQADTFIELNSISNHVARNFHDGAHTANDSRRPSQSPSSRAHDDDEFDDDYDDYDDGEYENDYEDGAVMERVS